MRSNFGRLRGFTLVEIMIVVAIISLLAVMAIPNLVRARTTTATNSCINNLKQIYAVKQQWALEHNYGPNAEPTLQQAAAYLKNPLVCPSGGSEATFNSSYVMNKVGLRPTCKIAPETHVLPSNTEDSQ